MRPDQRQQQQRYRALLLEEFVETQQTAFPLRPCNGRAGPGHVTMRNVQQAHPGVQVIDYRNSGRRETKHETGQGDQYLRLVLKQQVHVKRQQNHERQLMNRGRQPGEYANREEFFQRRQKRTVIEVQRIGQ